MQVLEIGRNGLGNSLMTLRLDETSSLYQISDLPLLLFGTSQAAASPLKPGYVMEKNGGETQESYITRLHAAVNLSKDWFISFHASNYILLDYARKQIEYLEATTPGDLDWILSLIDMDFCPEDTETFDEVIARVTTSIEMDPSQRSNIALEHRGLKLGQVFDSRFMGFGFEMTTWDYSKIRIGYHNGTFQWYSYSHPSKKDEVLEFLNPKFDLLRTT